MKGRDDDTTHVGRIVSPAVLLASTVRAVDEATVHPRRMPSGADFKLMIGPFGVHKPPTARAELVVRNGLAYQSLSDVPDEVTVIEPGKGRVRLLHPSASSRPKSTLASSTPPS